MLELIDEALESFLRASVPLSSTDVDVSFEAPDRDWSAKLVRPTVNLFLWDLRKSAERSQGGMRRVEREGVLMHEPALPVVELRYVVTAWTSDHGDERGLLSGLLRSLLAAGQIDREFLPTGLGELTAPTLLIARTGEDHMDVFKALEGQVKPGINIVVTTQIDVGVGTPAGPPVTSIEAGLRRLGGPPERHRRVAGEIVDAEERGAVGVLVRAPRDATRVNASGRFLLRASAGETITLELDPPQVVEVPDVGGIRFE